MYQPRGPRSPDRIPQPRSAHSRTPRRCGIKVWKATEARLSQKKIPALGVAEAQDEGGLAPGESNDLQRGCRKSPPAEVDHDLEIPVEGEPEPASFFKLADDYARLFELAREESLCLVE